MMGRVDFIIDGGECDVGIESTVLDVSGDEFKILRPDMSHLKIYAKLPIKSKPIMLT